MSRQKSSSRFRFSGASLLLILLVFLVPALRAGDYRLYLLAAAIPCAVFLAGTLLARMFSLDRMILSLSLCLCALGIAALAPSDPDEALAHSLRCCAGLAALLAGGVIIRSLSSSLLTSACTAFLGLLLLSGRLLAPSLTIPLAEISLALLLIAFSSLLARQGPVLAVSAALVAFALLLIRGDQALALLWGITVLLLLFAADGRPVVVLPSLAVILLLLFASVRLFPVQSAVRDSSLQAVLTASGAIGTETLPEAVLASETSSLLPRLAVHYGLIFTGLILLLFLPLALRGTAVASSARSRFHAVIAMGASLFLSLRVLSSLLSVFGFLPLPDLPVPLLTASLTDLCAELFLLGLVSGISGRNDADLAEDAHLAMLAK